MTDKFPNQIPVFPLSGVIYFPKTNLPLNIFEERYLNLVTDAYKNDKLMGMVQSKREGKSVYQVGCLGKISDFQKSRDGRILINLTGISRFKILEEVSNGKLYREFKVNYEKFTTDLDKPNEIENIELVMDKAKIFLKRNGLLLNWREFDKLSCTQKINTLSMISPIANEEKQKLLESVTLQEKAKAFNDIINFYLHESKFNTKTVQ